jgi:response regulator RpfG family c-di-GMP phosphodiesterase
MSTKKALSVGQCVPDNGRIADLLRSSFGLEVVTADTAEEALGMLREGPFHLVLVNRVFDLDGDSGVAFIRKVILDNELRKVPVLLVSNYEDAQAEAVAAGARPGFGKGSLYEPRTIELLRSYL